MLFCLSADFEFENSEVLYREKVLKNLEGYIHQIFPGMVFHGHIAWHGIAVFCFFEMEFVCVYIHSIVVQ